jgi:hypothetical protein
MRDNFCAYLGLECKGMSATDRSTAVHIASTMALSPFAVDKATRNLQETNYSSATAETDIRRKADSLDEVLEDYSFAEYPATDAFSDESIARWPAVTCSGLGSERIRLVKITPGPPGSTIEFEVSTCFLDQAPSYAAISYAWGSPSGFHEILVRGELHSVPKNLWRFLDQARRLPGLDSLAGWLWIDALSINQSDPREKLDQVGIIPSIFGKADRVIVWLGPNYANGDHALAALYANTTTRPKRCPRTLAGPVWSGIHSLCERPYWRRLWVYQELQSAQRAVLFCGHKLVPLRNFQEYMFDTAAPRLEDKFGVLRKAQREECFVWFKNPQRPPSGR